MKPKVISRPSIPNYIADNSTHAPLKAKYYSPIPNNLFNCQNELKLTRIDLVNCVIGHRNNNAEMKAIRKLNQQ